MPGGPGEGEDPYLLTVIQERPGAPVYARADEDAIPDQVITIIQVLHYPIWNWAKQLHDYINTTQFTYRCFRKYNAKNRNFWKIELTVQGTDIAGKIRTYKLYPWGCAGYNFDPVDISYYASWMTKF